MVTTNKETQMATTNEAQIEQPGAPKPLLLALEVSHKASLMKRKAAAGPAIWVITDQMLEKLSDADILVVQELATEHGKQWSDPFWDKESKDVAIKLVYLEVDEFTEDEIINQIRRYGKLKREGKNYYSWGTMGK